ncbi:hypothetical protein BOX15_Mlig030901g2, partial [Macrostomum lignano]
LYKTEAFPDLTRSSGVPTFSLEDSLPSYPVPKLSDTLDLYLSSTRPFLTDSEFAATRDLARQFELGIGRELQARLEQRAAEQRNWLADWWRHYAYLTNRTALHPLLNMAGVGPYHHQYWPARDGSATERAAMMCRYYAVVWKSLREQTFPVDKNAAGKYMSMEQFRRYFSSCQLPGRQADTLASHFRPRSEGASPRHFLVLIRGRMFSLDLLDEAEQPYTVAQYYRQLDRLVKTVESSADSSEMGDASSSAGSASGLYGLPRPDWFEARRHLGSLSPVNQRNLDLVEQAIFVLSLLLDERGCSNKRLLELALTGDIQSVVPDKSCNLMVTGDGVWLNNCGHTPMDGMTIALMTYYVEGQIYKTQGRIEGGPEDPCERHHSSEAASGPPAVPVELRLILDNHLMVESSRGLAENASQRASLDALPHEFNDFGRSELRRLRLHPDTVVQLALQLAYWRAHGGRPAPTYQTATTRQFHRGRTETIRSCTAEAVAMCRAVTAAGGAATAEARTAILAAHDRHNELRARCEAARGCDRHLLGLQLLAMESGGPLPSLFTDPAYSKSGGNGNFVLSTSYLGSVTAVGCVAPMCPDGYGVFYRIGPAKVLFNLTRWAADPDTSVSRLADCLDDGLRDIRRIVASAAAARL